MYYEDLCFWNVMKASLITADESTVQHIFEALIYVRAVMIQVRDNAQSDIH